jgi:3-deoxy-7-phosphoheptulonate synthase
MTEDWLLGLCETLNPRREAGRLVMIHRMGARAIGAHLPRLIRAMKNAGHRAVWLCDPMHGNTQTVTGGIKTRAFADIASEVEQAFQIHADCGSLLGGVHLELTGEDVTECIGGARDLSAGDLDRAYRSTIDPRLNYEQSLELALKIAALAPHSAA